MKFRPASGNRRRLKSSHGSRVHSRQGHNWLGVGHDASYTSEDGRHSIGVQPRRSYSTRPLPQISQRGSRPTGTRDPSLSNARGNQWAERAFSSCDLPVRADLATHSSRRTGSDSSFEHKHFRHTSSAKSRPRPEIDQCRVEWAGTSGQRFAAHSTRNCPLDARRVSSLRPANRAAVAQ